MFKGTSYYTKNTSLFITDVGEGDSEAVLCRTDLEGCCVMGRGHWIDPNGTNLEHRFENDNIFRSRGDMVVRLHRRNNATTPTGQYCCKVPIMATPNAVSTICIILSKFHGVTISM